MASANIRRTTRSDAFWIIVAATAIAAFLGLVFYVGYSFVRPAGPSWFRHDLGKFETVPFDSRSWRREAGKYDPIVRGRMYDDLAGNHIRAGMTRRQIVALLGPPDTSFLIVGRIWGYRLGRYRDCIEQMLTLHFDRRWRLRRADLLTPADAC